MKIEPVEDGDFSLVEMKDYGNTGRLTPHCKKHWAMLCITETGIWRCIRRISLLTGKPSPRCAAGCQEVR